MSQLHPNWRRSQKHPPLLTQLQKQPGFTLARFIVTFLLIVLVFTDTFVNVGSSLPRAQAASLPQPTQSHLNLQQYLKQGRPDNAYHGPLIWNSQPENPPADTHAAKVNTPLLPSHQPAHMQPITQPLPNAVLTSGAGGKDVTLVDSSKSFEVHLSVNAFDLSHAVIATSASKTSTPQGPFTISVKQLTGHSVGLMNVLGSYQLQVLDSQQHAVTGILLKHPISLVYHYQPAEITSFDLDAAHMVLSLPNMIATVQKTQKTTSAIAQQVASYTIPLTNDPVAHTLTAQLQVMPDGPADFAGDPQNQSPPTPHLASMGGNAGQSGYAYPLQVPPGPAGFAPNLALAYSSSGPNERHDRTSPAGGTGDGWGLSLGSISTEVYPSTSASPGSWFFLSGIAGASDRLVPDTTAGFFQTEHISRLKIQLLTSSVTNQPCFNVWDKDGTYYQIGCTADSLQYYNANGTRTNYRWDVNRIIAPNQGPGSTYKLTMVSYEQDKSADGSVRDAAIKQVTYGSGTATNAISSVDGTVDFHYRAPSNDGTWAVAYGTNYNCTGTVPGGSTTLRCDDPVQQAGSSVAAPKVMSTLSLQNVISYVGDDSATTHAAYEYDFSYQDNVFTFPCYDPYTLVQQSCAGEHLLKQIVPKVYLKGTSHQLKPVLFGYSGTLENFYTDENQTQQGNTTFYNVQTYWQYLTNYFDSNTGIGGQISYQTAYSNTEGTPYITDSSGNVIDDRHDPLYCTKHANDTDTTKRCSTFSLHHPDDQTWSVQVVTQIKTWGVDSSSTALQPAVTNYAYKLAATGTYGSGNFCYPASQTVAGQKDCVGDTWIPASNGTKDGDWQDFYHGEFHGFSQVYITSPSGNLTVASYNSTEGWKTPNSNSGNYNSGHLWKEDVYSGNSETGPLLEETLNQYTGNSGYQNSCNGKLNPVYNPCEVIMVSSKTTFYEGTTNSNAPWVQHNYTYDDYSSTTGLLAGYHNLTQEDVISSNAGPDTTHPLYSSKSQYVTYDTTISGTTYYKVNALSHSEIDDSSGHVWQCQDMTYDEGAAHQPTAGWLTTSKSYSDCTNKSGTAITTYAGYDKFGNAVAAVDGVATANSAFYTSNGCTLSTAPVYKSSNWSAGRYTACTVYDTYNAQVASKTNALGQTTSKTYDYTQDARPVQSTDANGQHISNAYSYDPNSSTNAKATVQVSEPGEVGSYTTQSTSNSTCAASLPTAAVTPCFEMDSNTSQYSGAVTRTFYDGQGRSVETLKPGPDATHTTVSFTFYNEQQHSTFQSQPFVVNARTTWLDPNGAVDINGNAPGGTATYLDALGRTIAVKDAIFNAGHSTGISCPSLGSNATTCTIHGLGTVGGSDTNVYDTTTNIDANGHVDVTYDDVLGRTRYYQSESGKYGGTLTVNALKTVQYNVLNKPTSMVVTDKAPLTGQTITSVTTTLQYDDLGRVTVMNDPDKGTDTYTYDADGHIVKDVSGVRTIGTSYDLLGRVGCIQDAAVVPDPHGACTDSTNHFVVNTYDADPSGVTWGSTNYAVGQLTQSYAINYFSSPDNTQGKVTENFQYDQRGRQVSQRLNITATGGTLVFPTFPQYQESLSYNDANQATMTQTTVGGSTGYTFTQSYDSTSGVLNGLSNTSTGNQSLAALSYNAQDQLSTLLLKATTGTNLAQVAYTYDGNLRPTNASATWQSGSGQSGTIFSEGTSYDATSNVLSQVMQQAAVPGQSNSGGTEAQNFCYDEQNRLVWASNSGTVPSAGNGTCGNLNFQSTLGGAYTNSYSYTHLGQLWEAPLNGNGTKEQYLYCNSSQPHQVTALAPDSGSPPTCSNMGTPDYQASYDNWGNMSSRTTSGSTGALSFDGLDHLMRWNASFGSTNNEEWYMYDGTGNRVLRRYINGSGTTFVTYPFGLEEHTYGSSGTDQGDNYYYTVGGRTLGVLSVVGSAQTTKFFLTDELGTIVSSFTNVGGSAVLNGNQAYGPYGNRRYHSGTLGTSKGFTGQYNDSNSGLDYYGSRYYDPIVGRFISADTVQGNLQGSDPYNYVGGNPETLNDPTGRCPWCIIGAVVGAIAGAAIDYGVQVYNNYQSGSSNPWGDVNWGQVGLSALGGAIVGGTLGLAGTAVGLFGAADATVAGATTVADAGATAAATDTAVTATAATDTGVVTAATDTGATVASDTGASTAAATSDAGSVTSTAATDTGATSTASAGAPEGATSVPEPTTPEPSTGDVNPCGGGLSFTPTTRVATARGEQPIVSLHVGEKVWAYNSNTKKMELQPILHVWINHDNDLVDLTITSTVKPGKATKPGSEVLHTNKKHPFLTVEKGFVPVGQIKLGMHVVEADGQVGVVSGWKLVPGVKTMYNLEVAQDHTYTVGIGQWVVHNFDCTSLAKQAQNTLDGMRNLEGMNAKALTVSDVSDASGAPIGSPSYPPGETSIGNIPAAIQENGGICSEAHCSADIVNALNGGGGSTGSSGAVNLGMQQVSNLPPCPDCMVNLASLANQINRVVAIGFFGREIAIDPASPVTYQQWIFEP